jgi:signal transduction histidine kinase
VDFSVRIRRAVLETSLKARSDIQSTLSQLQQWLDKQLKEMRQLYEVGFFGNLVFF